MTDKGLWDLRLSLAKEILTLTDKQVQYILDHMNTTQSPAGAHTEV